MSHRLMPLVALAALAACSDPAGVCDREGACEFEGVHLTLDLTVDDGKGAPDELEPGPFVLKLEVMNRGDSISDSTWVYASMGVGPNGYQYEGFVPPLEPGAVWSDSLLFDIPSDLVIMDSREVDPYHHYIELPDQFVAFATLRTQPFGPATGLPEDRIWLRVLLPVLELSAETEDTLVFGHEATIRIRATNLSPSAAMSPQTIEFRLFDYPYEYPRWGTVEIPRIEPGEVYEGETVATVAKMGGYSARNTTPVWSYTLQACLLQEDELRFCRGDYAVLGVRDVELCAGGDVVLGTWSTVEPICSTAQRVWRLAVEAGHTYRFTTDPPEPVIVTDRNGMRINESGSSWEAPANGTYYVGIYGYEGIYGAQTRLLVEDVTPTS